MLISGQFQAEGAQSRNGPQGLRGRGPYVPPLRAGSVQRGKEAAGTCGRPRATDRGPARTAAWRTQCDRGPRCPAQRAPASGAARTGAGLNRPQGPAGGDGHKCRLSSTVKTRSQAVASRPGDTGSVRAGRARTCQGLSLPGRGLGPLPPGWHMPTPRGSEPSRLRGWARPGAIYRSSGHSRPAAAEPTAS